MTEKNPAPASAAQPSNAGETDAKITVEVAYATPQKQKIIPLQVTPGCTAWDAARLSKISEHFPEIDLETSPMGIFSDKLDDPRSHTLKAGERVEIYRALIVDPKEARRLRAKKAQRKRAAQAGGANASDQDSAQRPQD